MTDLELTFDSITPENLKNNETISKLMKLYNSSFSEISAILYDPLSVLDTDYLIEKFEETADIRFDNIRKEIFKIHLQEIYKTFEDIGDSEEIYLKFKTIYEALGVPTDNLKIIADIDKSIDSQYLNASKSFKTKKGTRSGFFFVYDIINKAGIQAINADDFFNFIEGTREDNNIPYQYSVETSLYKEVFKQTVVPLAHPVGFIWHFTRLMYLTLEDYFGLIQHKTLGETTVTCYGAGETAINQQEIINSEIYGEFKSYNVTIDSDNKEKVVIDYLPIDNSEDNGYRFIKDYNGRIILYDRQSKKIIDDDIEYLEISDIRLIDEQNGLLSINKIIRNENEVIDSIEFDEYTIINKEVINLEYKIIGDLPDVWNKTVLPLTKKIISEDKKFFETEYFTRQDILDYSIDYNGKVIEDKGINCLLTYKAIYTYEVITSDVSEYVRNKRPNSLVLETDVNNILIPRSEYDIAISEGRDPYAGLYSTVDHTIEETNWYDSGDNWARLDFGNYKLTGDIGETNINPIFNTGHISPEKIINEQTGEISYIEDGEIIDLVIGGDWILSDNHTHEFDRGYNKEKERWEQYYRPKSEEDLAIINSPTSPERYERDNTEWYGEPLKFWDYSRNNQEYTAWENIRSAIHFNVFKDKEECHDTYIDWNIGDQDIGCSFIDGIAAGSIVDADPVNLLAYTSDQVSIYLSPLDKDYANYDIDDDNVGKFAYANNIYLDSYVEDSDDFYRIPPDNPYIGDFTVGDFSITWEYMYKEDTSCVCEFNMFSKSNLCYDTMISWPIGEEPIGCAYIAGTASGGEVQGDIYRSQWNFYNIDEFEKYEISEFNILSVEFDGYPEEYTTENPLFCSLMPLDVDEFYKDSLDLYIGQEIYIGGTIYNEETDSDRDIYLAYEYMFKESYEVLEGYLVTPLTYYSYNTFIVVYIGDELIISDNGDYIDGKGVNLLEEADIYRADWEVHDDYLVTVDNVIESTYEVYGMKVYKKDDDGEWVYMPDNNIDAA